LPNGIFDVV